MNFPQILEDDYKFIDDTLEKYGNDHSVLDCSELDGFLTAVVSGLEMIMPSTWMSALWGGEEHAPEWKSEDEARRFIGLVMEMMNQCSMMLMDEPESFEAIFLEGEIDGQVYTIVTDWCHGYLRVVEMHPESWIRMPEDLIKKLALISLFGSDENFGEFDALGEEQIRILKADIEPAVRAIHAYWLKQREAAIGGAPVGDSANISPIVREAPKVGRNDPCPCESGRKYKKCCGMH